jgi:ABC-type multidrug transport system fused ATPase/permease subunit
VLIYFGARGIVQNWASFGLLVMFIAYTERFFHPIQDLSEKFDIMQSANAAGEKILSLLRTPAAKEDGQESKVAAETGRAARQPRFQGSIRFEEVWFSYIPEEWVLRGVSFEVKPRETLAIVGETGAGKTTIINILARFYPVQRGRVLIDGRDIAAVPHAQVRENIGIVMQDIFLFSRSIRENIVLGSGFDRERFNRAVDMSHLNRFLQMLPAGEEEPVMERGVTFSAGERQLLSFARALYADPSILVLDEATSSIDTETEMLIQDAITRLTRGRTSIIIAHRLSTIRNADRILVLEKGRIAEQGSHQELMKKKGLYHRFYSLQFGTLT